MEQLSFVEKLDVLFQNILAHPIFICILLSPIILVFLNKKIKKKAIIFIYIVILLIVLFIGNTTIFALFDNLVDGIFMTLYFPNFITLFLVEVISAVICFITFFKKGITKITKVINITSFAIIQTIFILILTIIEANEIDIYKENALYANNDVLTLMQLLMGTFALQIVSLLVIKAIDKVTARLDGKTSEPKVIRRLPEGRITHATLAGAKVIKKKEVKIEPEKPLMPLNKSFIKEEKINPLDLNEELIKEKSRPHKATETLSVPPKSKVEVKYVIPEVKLDPMVPVPPLDNSLIIKEKINPMDVSAEVLKEKERPKKIKFSEELVEKAKAMEKNRTIFTVEPPKPTMPLDKSLIKEEKINPININKVSEEDKKQEVIKEETSKARFSEKFRKQVTGIKNKLKDVYETKERKTFSVPKTLEPTSKIPMVTMTEEAFKAPNKFVSETNNRPEVLEINPKEVTMPDLMKPMDVNKTVNENNSRVNNLEKAIPILDIKPEYPDAVGKLQDKERVISEVKEIPAVLDKTPEKPKVFVPSKPDEEKELIANLEIIDFDKMVKAIKNLKIIYTL